MGRAFAILSALAVLFSAAPASADTVIRKDGGQFECLITSSECPTCRGEQTIACPVCDDSGRLQQKTCPRCNGQSKIACPTCGGLGYAGSEITVLVKGGIRFGMPTSDIASVIRREGAEEDFLPPKVAYRKKAAKVAPDDAQGNMKLARWALDAGLVDEAEVHFLRVRLLDPSQAARVDPLLSRIRRDREKKVEDAVSKALALVVNGRMEEAKSALEEITRKYPESVLVRSPARQKEAITAAFGDDAGHGGRRSGYWGRTFDEVIATLDKRLRTLCPACSGAGTVTCTQCNGIGDAGCTRCRGTGYLVCPDCNGTGRQICPRCLGAGRVKAHLGFASEVSGTCGLCKGVGTIRCQSCASKGKIQCTECNGAGHIKGACLMCGGTGRGQCNTCLGTGLRPPERYAWGPYSELPPGSTAGGGPVGFQGKVDGTILTVLPSTVVYSSRLAFHLDGRLGGKHAYLLLCVDNRAGNKVLHFDPEGRSLRIVSPDARQLEMLPPASVVTTFRNLGAKRELLEVLSPGDILPGVVRSFLCVFPAESSIIKPGTRVFWGTDEIWELDLVDARVVATEE